ncbi:glyoxalase [Mycobacterium liflandii 128FXT]|uniref:Glyoxalase n=1 Tax=Mycobacterium liflandii (strain 128FXT) TaxID=459424 RepID=L7V3C3_MYCL1|nr:MULTISPECIES: VOC family protein [Mycobacterium ulcerans group]AGC61035.1 glyoxalase [Mycobacterium liflandii 128FXT]
MAITGISHVALTVTDLDRSAAWYAQVLGWTEINRGRDATDVAVGLLPGGLPIVLRRHDITRAESFEESRPGLDHLSFQVASTDDLSQLTKTLTDVGATFTPAQEFEYGWILPFRDPDNIALEAQLPNY